jgi:hypothetical protein
LLPQINYCGNEKETLSECPNRFKSRSGAHGVIAPPAFNDPTIRRFSDLTIAFGPAFLSLSQSYAITG